jgi:serine/threonine-protein kinase
MLLGQGSEPAYNGQAVEDPTTTEGATLSLDPEPTAEVSPGSVISGRYRVDELIAKGGVGAVYRGTHLLLRKRVAIKVLHAGADREIVQRFEREALAGAHVQHPNVASATDFGQLDDGSYFLILEHVRGRTLHDEIMHGALPVKRAVHIARQVASALEGCHARGVVHRDVKPRNVMIVDGEYLVAKLIDFGFAKVQLERLSVPEGRYADKARVTMVGTVFGTIAYLAPEAVTGMDAVDTRSDLYALGIMFYEMLAGRRPFEHRDAATLFMMHREAPVPSIDDYAPEPVPAPIQDVVRRLLEKDPAQRFASAFEVIDAIDRAMVRSNVTPMATAPFLTSAPRPIDSTPPPPSSATPTVAPAPADYAPRRARATSRAGWIGGGAAFVVAAVLAWMGVAHLAASTAPTAIVPSAPTEPLHAPAVATSRVEAPEASAKSAPPNPDREALRGAIKQRAWRLAEASALGLVARDPEAFADTEISAATRDTLVALHREGDDRAEELMNALVAMGPRGLDVLYDTIQTRGGSRAALRVTALLRKPDVNAAATPELRIAFALRDATCDGKLLLLERAVNEGDSRSLTALEAPGCPRRQQVEQAAIDLRKRLADHAQEHASAH